MQDEMLMDVDGNAYQVTVVGTQRWMAANLRTTRFSNGDPIPMVSDAISWSGLEGPGWVSYGNEALSDALYGKLYNWSAIRDQRNVCPMGWHVPTDADWKTLEAELGMQPAELDLNGLRGMMENVGGQMKAMSLWMSPNSGATNSSDLTAVPGGQRAVSGGFSFQGTDGYWWSATEDVDTNFVWTRGLEHNAEGIRRQLRLKKYGLSVCCVQN